MLVQFQPHVLKIDMELIRNIDQDPVRQAIVCGIVLVCQRLSVDIVAEGIETSAESAYLRSLGVRYPQGYLFAKPGSEFLPLAPRHAQFLAAPLRAVYLLHNIQYALGGCLVLVHLKAPFL